ncbi:phosphatase PAP2 family protein [Gordonia soli]|uniref:Phosphatidic acid phosphatase type 2/haloperoxidase domain-containing protein n=1 Tax=Gordonia soli NBRC 108243 TaxID=1223545 RepID=M0QJ49_9ACTN|nr:hypothetical protein GS4_14_01440 [Gordonia soli NBRC 108243]
MELTSGDFDRSITDWVVEHRTAPAEAIAHAVTITGNTVVLTAVVVVATIALAIRGHRAEAMLVGAGSLVGYLLMLGTKALFQRDRPPVRDRLIDIDTFSFPSGHAMMSTVVLGLIAVAAYRISTWVHDHPAVLLLAPVWAVLVGISRVVLGVHWTTDVIAGWVIGAVWVVVCAVLVSRVPRTADQQ